MTRGRRQNTPFYVFIQFGASRADDVGRSRFHFMYNTAVYAVALAQPCVFRQTAALMTRGNAADLEANARNENAAGGRRASNLRVNGSLKSPTGKELR